MCVRTYTPIRTHKDMAHTHTVTESVEKNVAIFAVCVCECFSYISVGVYVCV